MKDYLIMSCPTTNDVISVPDTSVEEYLNNIQFYFQDALTYSGPIYDPSSADANDNDDGRIKEFANDAKHAEFEAEPIPLAQVAAYESAMQYATVSLPSTIMSSVESGSSDDNLPTVDTTTFAEIFQSTIQRCSLIRTAFQIVAAGQSYEELASIALDSNSFTDIMTGGTNENATWSIRLRRYGPMEIVEKADTSNNKRSKRQARYGKNVRSPLRDERKAIFAMKDLVECFSGEVDLNEPDCRLYLLEGLKRCDAMLNGENDVYLEHEPDDALNGNKLLARVVAKGPKVCRLFIFFLHSEMFWQYHYQLLIFLGSTFHTKT